MPDSLLPKQIANTLRREILKGNLKPGQPIKERDHAKKMDVSRTPMREAVRILSQEGLVTLRKARSPIVAEPSFKHICEAIEVLTTLELRCGVLACKHATASELEHLTALQTAMQDQYANIDAIDLFEMDMEFHMAIAKASHNTVLTDTHHSFVRRLWHARFMSVQYKSNNELGQAQHKRITEAVRNRDAEQVHLVIFEHLEDITSNIRDQYACENTED
jgi:DNA-binding GntR family transcriptional regulator